MNKNAIDTRNDKDNNVLHLQQAIERAAKAAGCAVGDLLYQYGTYEKMNKQVSQDAMFVSADWSTANIPENLVVTGSFPRGVYASTLTPYEPKITAQEIREGFYNQHNGFQKGSIPYFIAMQKDASWVAVGSQAAPGRTPIAHICKHAGPTESTLKVNMVCWGVAMHVDASFKYEWAPTAPKS